MWADCQIMWTSKKLWSRCGICSKMRCAKPAVSWEFRNTWSIASLFRAIRIIGEVTPEKIRMVQDADAIYREEVANAGIAGNLGQYFVALTNMRSVGVMGDERTYDYAIALRAVTTTDFMTAESAQIPWEVLSKVTSRIVNEVPHINRVLYDCTGKPPATIEFE